MSNTEQQKGGTVQRTKNVINIDAVMPDNNRKEDLITTDFAEALKNEAGKEAPLSKFPNEENKTDNDETEEEKKK
jgi:hypothetical protein